MASMRAMTRSTSTPERRAISANGSRTKPSILSSEIARIFALIGSSCSDLHGLDARHDQIDIYTRAPRDLRERFAHKAFDLVLGDRQNLRIDRIVVFRSAWPRCAP